jgi:zinc transport system substrate-binding protein
MRSTLRSAGLATAAVIVISIAVVAGCSKPSDSGTKKSSADDGRRVVVVTNHPMFYFTQRIGGDVVDVLLPVSPDGDPAFWNPTAEDVAKMQAADLVLLNGATYEKWLDKVTLSESKLVPTADAFRDDWITIADAITHSHGPEGEHTHAGTAFTTWIDFQQAKQQAASIRDALAKLVPASRPTFDANFAALATDLDALDASMMAVANQIGSQPLMTSHPVYHYWARRYGLVVKYVHWEPEVVPDEAAIADLRKILESHPARWMIWEGPPVAESVALLDGLGIRSVVFDPAGNVDPERDWLAVMKENIANLEAIGTTNE